jgi:hypothetical protein
MADLGMGSIVVLGAVGVLAVVIVGYLIAYLAFLKKAG